MIQQNPEVHRENIVRMRELLEEKSQRRILPETQDLFSNQLSHSLRLPELQVLLDQVLRNLAAAFKEISA